MSASIPVTARDRARRLGIEHAIRMLYELSAQEKRHRSCISEDGRHGPQDISVVLRYLGTLQPQYREGFAAVLTDYLWSALEGCAPDVDLYEQMLEERRI